VLNLPDLRAGKVLIYTGIKMPLIALADLNNLGYTELSEIVSSNNGLWSAAAEKYLLANSENI